MNNGTGRVWAVNANGGDEGRPNGVGPVYIENIDKIGGGVPDPSGASTGDVLTVDSQGNPAWEPPTGGGGGSYTAGNGIEIENDQISIDTDVVATKSDLPDMSEYATESELTSGLAAKQDVISDLATIRSGAAAGATAVQPAVLNDYATTTALTEGLAAKQDTISDLSTIRSGAQAGATAVQPAALNDYATTSALTSGLAAKQDTISDLSTIRSGASAGATAVQPGSLATVATTGSYADLSNKPSLATVATSGSYDDLSNKPSIPAAQVQTDWDAVSGLASIANKPNLATVATSGSYNDLSDKPTIPAAVTVDQHYDALSANPQSGVAVAEAISGTGQVPSVTSADDNKVLMASYSGGVGSWSWEPSAAATQVNADWEASSGVAEILHKPDLSVYAQSANLATVATSGDYNDLSNRPSIPAAQVNADWDANSGVAQILNKPTLATVATSGDYADLQNKPTIPAAQVQSDWNAVSGVSAIANKPDLSVYATNSDLTSGLATKQDTISDLSTIRSGAAAGATAVQPGSLATVATTGAYADLSGTPTIPTVDQTYDAGSTNAMSGVAVASAIASNIDQTYDHESPLAQSGVAIAGALATKQDTISDLSTIRSGAQAGATAVQPGSLATVATTGAYADLSGKPTIPTVDQVYDAGSTNAMSGVAVASAISNNIDQTYDSTSPLAQSGTAVAQAIAAIPAPQVSGIVEEFDWSTVSYSDINTCLTNGNTPVILYDRFNDGAVQRAYLQESVTYSTGTTYRFYTPVSVGALDTSSQNGTVTRLTITSDTKNVDYNEPVNVKFIVDSTLNLTQPSQYSSELLLSVVDPVPSHTSTESGKVLGVDANGALEWATPATVTVDQTYNASSANAQSGTAVAGALASYTPTASLATVATSGNYNDLSNKPTIPTVPDTKPVVAGSNVTITEGANDITISATDTTYSAGTGISISSGTISNSDPLPSHTSTESGKVLGVDANGALEWATPSTVTVDQTYNASSSNAQSGTAVAGALASYTPTASLATVATTGAYSDLSGTPTIPVIGTVTIPDPTPEPSEADPLSGDNYD